MTMPEQMDMGTAIESALSEPPTETPRPQTQLAVQEEPASGEMPVVEGVCVPRHSGDVKRLANLAFSSGLAPKGATNVAQAIMGIMAGMEVGLTFVQACRQVMVVNGSPSLWGDAPLGLVMKSGHLEDIQVRWEGTKTEDSSCSVVVKRKGVATAGEGKFAAADARAAGLWGKKGPWTNYPRRMLELRARAFALRNMFPDVLLGCAIAEEHEGVQNESDAADVNRRIDSL
jgi:hypothetical protein